MSTIGALAKDEVLARFAAHVSSGKVERFRAYGLELVLGRREGIHVWDLDGERRLINCHSNGGVFNLGHRHPRIVRELVEAAAELDIGNHHLVSEHRALLGERLAATLPGDLSVSVFAVSGGEAVDLAIKVVRAFTGRTRIISALGGYHGHTGLALAAGDEKYRAPFGPPAPGFVQVPFGDLDALAAAIDGDTAAVLLETVPATLGIVVPTTDYMQGVRALCDRTGTLLVVDEIQTGLGRTGRVWGIEHFDVVPDVLVTGKGLSGGMYPIAATCFAPRLERVFASDPFIHVSTFGGAELGCRVALAVLEATTRPGFLEAVTERAATFRAGFLRLAEAHPRLVRGHRQLGLMMGLELAEESHGLLMMRFAFDEGLLAFFANNDPRVLQVLPPLIIDDAQAGEVIDRLDRALGRLAAIS